MMKEIDLNDPIGLNKPAPKAEKQKPRADLWQVEEWKGRYLVIRYLPAGNAQQRQIHSDSKLGSPANIYETQEAAASECKRLNDELLKSEKEGDE